MFPGFLRRRVSHLDLLAARLCSEAQDGQILVSGSLLQEVEDLVYAESVGDLILKGFRWPVPGYNLTGLRPAVARTSHSFGRDRLTSG